MKKKLSFILFILLFINEKFFFIIQFIDWRLLLIITSILLFINYKIKGNEIYPFKSFTYGYLILLSISAGIVYYNNISPVQTIFRVYSLLALIITYFPLTAIGYRYGPQILIKTLIYFARFTAIILLLQYLGITNIIPKEVLSTREDAMRSFIGIYALLLGSIFQINQLLYNSKKSLKTIGWILLCLITIIIVNQSRSTIAALVGAIGVLIYYRYNSNKINIKKIIFYIITGIIVCYAYIYITSSIQESISIEEASSVKRIEAYSFYMQKFIEHPIFGVGFTDINSLIVQGHYNKLFIEDIGLIGYLAQAGCFGIIVLLILVGSYIKITKQIKGSNKILCNSLSTLFIILLPFNLILNIDNAIIYLTFILSIISSIYVYNSKSQTKKLQF